MASYVRKNITMSRKMDARIRKLAKERGESQSSLIERLVRLGISAESDARISLLRYIGVAEGRPGLSRSVNDVAYGVKNPR